MQTITPAGLISVTTVDAIVSKRNSNGGCAVVYLLRDARGDVVARMIEDQAATAYGSASTVAHVISCTIGADVYAGINIPAGSARPSKVGSEAPAVALPYAYADQAPYRMDRESGQYVRRA